MMNNVKTRSVSFNDNIDAALLNGVVSNNSETPVELTKLTEEVIVNDKLYQYKAVVNGVTIYYDRNGNASTGDTNDNVSVAVVDTTYTPGDSSAITDISPIDTFANNAMNAIVGSLSQSEITSLTPTKAYIIANKSYMIAEAMMAVAATKRPTVTKEEK